MYLEDLGELRRLLKLYSDEHPGYLAIYALIEDVDEEIEKKVNEK